MRHRRRSAWQAGHDAVRVLCAVRVTLCVSGIVRAVHQSSSKLGETPLVRLDLFESLPSRRFGCRASTTNSTTNRALHRSTTEAPRPAADVELYSSTALQSALHLYSSTALYTLHPLHPPSDTDTNRLTRHTASWLPHTLSRRTHNSGPHPPCRPPQHSKAPEEQTRAQQTTDNRK